MAFVNKMIRNSKTGQSYRFIQTTKSTNNQLLEMESVYEPHSTEPPAHYHPYQAEDFTVLSGEVTVRVDSEIRTLRPGDNLHIAAGQVHAMWNKSETKAVVNWKIRPAMNSEYLFETVTGLANDGKTDAHGKPGMLQAALTVNKFSKEFRLSKPPFGILRIVFLVLTPVAWLAGYRPTYKKYID